MPEPLNAVIAGSKSFVEAVQPRLQLRLGAAPEVAPDPAAALQACARRGGLLVFEHGAPEWAEALRSLRGRQGPVAVAVIAAVADLASAAQPIDGVDEVVPWQGRPDPVMWAVERVVARARARPEAPPPIARAPAPPVVAAPAVELDVYELGGSDVPPPEDLPSAAEVELLLCAAVGGRAPEESPHAAITARVVAGLTALERAALEGAEMPVAPEPVRAAAALRWRAAALLERFAANRAPDPEEIHATTAAIDVALATLKALGEAAPAAQPLVTELRNALVKSGIEIGDAASRANAEAAPASAAAPPQARAAPVRFDSADPSAEPSSRRALVLGALLAASLVVALAFHGWRASTRGTADLPRFPGAPEGFVSLPAAPGQTLLVSYNGRIDPEELSQFKAQQEAKGITVRQVSSGTLLLVPRPPEAARATSTGAQP